MHPYTIPEFIKDRVIRRQGKLFSHDTVEAARSALIVVDMQNYFVADGFPLEVPMARQIVGNINRLARALRAAGGTVVWVQIRRSIRHLPIFASRRTSTVLSSRARPTSMRACAATASKACSLPAPSPTSAASPPRVTP
jgi:hypothetical protein